MPAFSITLFQRFTPPWQSATKSSRSRMFSEESAGTCSSAIAAPSMQRSTG